MAVPLNPAEQVRTLLNIIVRNVGKRELWKSFKKPNTPDYILNRVFSTAITAGITTPQVVLNRIRRWNAKYSEGALQGSDSEFIRYIARSIKYRSDPRLLLALSQTSPSLESKEKDQEEKEQKKLKEQKETEQKKILGGGKPATPPVPVPSVSKPIPSPSAKWVLPEKIAKIPTELHKDSVLRKAFPKTSPITQAPTSGIPPKPIPTSSAKWTLPENYAKVAVTIPSRSILRQAFPRTTSTTAPPSQVSPSRPINQPSNQSQPSSPPLQRENLPSRNRRLTPPFVPFRSLAIKTAQRFLIPGIVIGIVLFTILYPFFKDLLQSSALLPLSVSENACFNQGGGNCPSSQEIEANSEDQNTCKFLNPGIDIHDSSKPAGLSAYIDKYKPLFVQNYSRNTGVSQTEAGGEFDKRLDYILTRSKQVGLNPMLFLALWKSENDFSSAGDSVYHMGCMAGSLDFYSQVDCATGIGDIDPSLGEKNSRGETIGSFSSRCASPKNPHRASACGVLESIRSSHPDIYPNDHSISPFNNPIQTFDEWEESFGPHSPILNRPKTSTNNNCIHAYNLHIQIAELAGACKQGSVNTSATSINSCKFYRADQTSARCPESFRCEPGLTFSSPKLISYIDKVAKDTGVPASLLGGIVRVEATVPQHDASDTSIWVQTPYSISDYTDADIDYIEQEVTKFGNDESKAKNTYIPNTARAVCPYSKVGALGIMQMYSRTPTGDDLELLKKYRPDKYTGTRSLTVADYCNPLNSLYLGSGLILRKMGSLDTARLSDKNYISQITKIYFGANAADGEAGKMYEDSLSESINNCSVSASSSSSIPLVSPGTGNKIVVIDPGHGDPDPDTGQGKSEEGRLNLEVAGRVKSLLEAKGVEVGLTHEKNLSGSMHYESLQERARRINTANGLFFVSIHFDSGSYGDEGPKTFYNNKQSYGPANEKLATYISSSLSKSTGESFKKNVGDPVIEPDDATIGSYSPGGGISPTNCSGVGPHYILGTQGTMTCPNHEDSRIKQATTYPGVISEYFSNGKSYLSMLADSSFVDKIAQGYTNGIMACLNDPACATGGGTGFAGGNIPTITSSQTSSSCVQNGNIGKFQYFCQGNPSPWAGYPYACENMAYAGCGPTSMAMVLATFGNNVTPQTVAKDFTDHGWAVCNEGTNMLGILNGSAKNSPREYLKNKGVVVGTSIISGGGIDLQAAKAAIDAGGYIIASGNPFPSCNCGHIVVIDNVDVEAGTVHVQDPICSKENTENIYPANPDWTWNYAFPISKI